MTTAPATLREGYRQKFNEADAKWARAIKVDTIAMLLGIVAVFATPGWSLVLATASLFLLFGSWVLKGSYSAAKQIAEEGRRAYVLVDGLGYELKGKRRTDLLERLPRIAAQSNQETSEEYFSNAEGQGLARVLKNTQESAFWTRHLAGDSAFSENFQTVVMALCAFGIFLGCVCIDLKETRLKVAQCAVLVIAGMITRDNISRSIAYTQAKNDAALIDERLENESLDSLSPQDQLAVVALVLGDYNALASGMPVLSKKLHTRRKEELNKLWNERQEKDLATTDEEKV